VLPIVTEGKQGLTKDLLLSKKLFNGCNLSSISHAIMLLSLIRLKSYLKKFLILDYHHFLAICANTYHDM
jgi:hypothetical protein